MNDTPKMNGAAHGAHSATPSDSSEHISKKLRELYDSVADEGVSDRFLDLLERLDQAEKESGPEGESS
ncbi:hypothetical protein GCM10007879_01950 [Maritalea porphyrae]|uniref:Anti-sigma factor NepR domain-containing protein n=1 Tax=Maritalea porphyrae TaxID=880732 RepID=A0ABQ5ULN4_9HYPH|nr:hypothetical protein GCM10007879_01950 [Maritalea porphyrae]